MAKTTLETAPTLVREIFELDGKTLIYEYKTLSIEQVQNVEAVFRYYNDQCANPAPTLEQIEGTSGRQYMLEAMQHALLEQVGGVLRDYDENYARSVIRPLLAKMKAGEPDKTGADNYQRLRRCRRDFFLRVRLFDVELDVSARRRAQQVLWMSGMKPIDSTASDTSSSSNSPDSTTPESSSTD